MTDHPVCPICAVLLLPKQTEELTQRGVLLGPDQKRCPVCGRTETELIRAGADPYRARSRREAHARMLEQLRCEQARNPLF